jgi:hypothetical protein
MNLRIIFNEFILLSNRLKDKTSLSQYFPKITIFSTLKLELNLKLIFKMTNNSFISYLQNYNHLSSAH